MADKGCSPNPVLYCKRSWHLIRITRCLYLFPFSFCFLVYFDCVMYFYATATVSIFFKYANVVSAKKAGVIIHLYLRIMAASLQKPLYFVIVPQVAALWRGSTETVLTGLSHLSLITLGFLWPQNCYRTCWNIITTNNEIFFSRVKKQFPSCLRSLRDNESSCETIHKNIFPHKVHFHVNQTRCFALRLVLKPRHKVTQKWPIT